MPVDGDNKPGRRYGKDADENRPWVDSGQNTRLDAMNDLASASEDGSVKISLTANDSGADDDFRIRSLDTGNALGAVMLNPDGDTVTYKASGAFESLAAGQTAVDTFAYTVSDGHGGTDTAIVSVTVTGVNDAPMAMADSATVSTDGSTTISVTANDSDIDAGDELDILSIDTGGTLGMVMVGPDGDTVTYDPHGAFADLMAGHTATDSFTYTVSDGRGGTATATVTVTITGADGDEMPDDDVAMPGEDMPGHDMPDDDTGMDGMDMEDHMAIVALVPDSEATHVAVSDGSWFDPATWADGEIPGDGARVVIPEGMHVTYDGVSDTRLFTVRVDGQLDFATGTDSKMVIDTMVVTHDGKLTIGTEEQPVEAGVNVDIVIANNGPIDLAWDPSLISRGVISMGAVEMYGQEKTTDLKVAVDPMAGDTSITLAEAPLNWQPGDTLVLAGTHYDGYKYDGDGIGYFPPEDEVLTISRIEGNEVFFDKPLVHDHDSPRADLKTSVANYSRNITIGTEDPDSAAVYERGHVMFMGSNDVDVRYVAFDELGRTDKSIPLIEDFSHGEVPDDPADNVRARYPFHLHHTGVHDQEDPVIAIGNAVFGSPGWGFVQHDSSAIFHDNATYNTFGAGFVAETGNETGSWTDNIAIYAQGIGTSSGWPTPKNGNGGDPFYNFDLARTGDGFWFQGRLVESHGNIAASVNDGFAYFHRAPKGGMLPIDPADFDFPEALQEGTESGSSPNHAPILHFSDNETFAARAGLFIEKADPNQHHDVYTHLKNFTAWSVIDGAEIGYTSHYVLENFDLTGKEKGQYTDAHRGISITNNATDMIVINPKIAGFPEGVFATRHFTEGLFGKTDYVLVNPEIFSAKTPVSGFDQILGGSDVVPGRFEIKLDGPLVHFNGTTLSISGVKTDSLGEIAIPSGTDSYDVGAPDIYRLLEEEGFYEAADGKRYFVLESYYTDRLTGEVHKVGHLVEIDANVPLQNPYHPYADAKFAGMMDLDSAAPVTTGEAAETTAGADMVVDLLANDSDPDGDMIAVDGIVQPEHGKVFDNGDGTVTYRPDFGFTGNDSFKYWVTDGQGNFTPATVSIDVAAGTSTTTPTGETAKPSAPMPAPAPSEDTSAPTDTLSPLQQTSFTVDEDTLLVTDSLVPDPEGDTRTIEIVDGQDSGLFSYDQATGTLRFLNAPDFETPADQNRDNLYTVNIRLSNGSSEFIQPITVRVQDTQEPAQPGSTAGNGGAEGYSLYGGSGSDIIQGYLGDDILAGNGGDDLLYGWEGHDLLIGDGGNDQLVGGAGNDVLTGRGGNDHYLFEDLLFGHDTVIGWQEGNDRLDFRQAGLGWGDFTISDAGTGTMLELTDDPAQSVFLVGVAAGMIDATDFI